MMDTLAARVALSLGWHKQWGMPLWYDKDGNLIRTGMAWGALPSLEVLRGAIFREAQSKGWDTQTRLIDTLNRILFPGEETSIYHSAIEIANFTDVTGWSVLLAFLSATPEQIAQAWLAVVSEKES